MSQDALYLATGRRKNAVARVRAVPGSGVVVINKKPLTDFFRGLDRHIKQVQRPIDVYASVGKAYDYDVIVNGGGITGQAEATRHGIARAMLKINEESKATLRKEGLLTRDPRMVERKKPGRPKARKRFQFSKR